MKLTVGDYEVDVKARKTKFRSKMNEPDTMSFLNTLSLAFQIAEDKTEGRCIGKGMGVEIFNALDKAGYYDEDEIL